MRLKDLGGLRYSEITDIPPFDNLKFFSLPRLYKDAKRRMENNKEKTHKLMHRPHILACQNEDTSD